MKFEIPKIHVELRLSDYAPEFGDAVIQVRVNPPRSLIEEWGRLIELAKVPDADASEINQGMNNVIAQLWGWPTEDVTELENASLETDPALMRWLVRKTWELIMLHRAAIKKN